MARSFLIHDFVQEIPVRLLETFFQRADVDDLEFRWRGWQPADADVLVKAIYVLPRKQGDKVEAIFREIHSLACDTGVVAVREAARACCVSNVDEILSNEPNLSASMMQVWLKHRKVFEKAIMIHEIEHCSWWRKRDDLPRRAPAVSSRAHRRFARRLSELYLTNEGRGKECTVVHLCRGSLHYFVARPDDYAQSHITHDRRRKLRVETIRPTFPVMFVYDSAHGSLELCAKGSSKFKEKLEFSFAETILDYKNLQPWQSKTTVNLQVLKNRLGLLKTDFRDGISATDFRDGISARIVEMRIRRQNSRRAYTLHADKEGQPDDIYDMLDHDFDPDRMPPEEIEVKSVKIWFKIEMADGHRAKSITVPLTDRGLSTVRNHSPEVVELITKCLQRSKVIRERPNRPHDAAART